MRRDLKIRDLPTLDKGWDWSTRIKLEGGEVTHHTSVTLGADREGPHALQLALGDLWYSSPALTGPRERTGRGHNSKAKLVGGLPLPAKPGLKSYFLPNPSEIGECQDLPVI